MPVDFYDQLENTHPDYDAQVPEWEKMEDLYLGSRNVKEKGPIYLPMTEIEANEANRIGLNKKSRYQQRLDNAVFFNGIDRLIKFAMGQMYGQPIKINMKAEGPISRMLMNMDLMGSNVNNFFKNVSTFSYLLGHRFIIVDYPSTNEIRSLADQRKSNLHPYMIDTHPMEIPNWSVSYSDKGYFTYDWLVHKQTRFESPDPFSDYETVAYYKIWYPDHWEYYKCPLDSSGKPDTARGELIDEQENPIQIVPVVPVYSQVVRPMVTKPPLSEAGDLNIDHYRVLSSFNNGLMYHLNPILAFFGVSEDKLKVGASIAYTLPRNADAKYIEFQGASLKLAFDEAMVIAAEMWESGMKSSSAIGANTSAEARRLRANEFKLWLLSVVANHEWSYRIALHYAGLWEKTEIDRDQVDLISINKDYDLTALDANQTEFFLNARKAGEISRKRFFEELQRGEVISKDVDVDQEIKDAKADLAEDLKTLAKAEASVNSGSGGNDGATDPDNRGDGKEPPPIPPPPSNSDQG